MKDPEFRKRLHNGISSATQAAAVGHGSPWQTQRSGALAFRLGCWGLKGFGGWTAGFYDNLCQSTCSLQRKTSS